ncbi:PP2C family protein-serine/threonine phosphatase [Demequina aestuarii]|uniref:PP2C family protein-serine/threonine phosphatase n=1 Tax=Demequina aestuarii TaxID=327095 RepID=UPI0007814252|nr:protein phosphatase 2C domain-containing protein [Demequina aestuarii]
MNQAWTAGGGATDPGPRERNEDAFLSAGPVHVVADGMGGHLAGAAASRTAIDALRPLVDRDPVRPEDVVTAVDNAHAAVEQLSASLGGESGTTLTGAVAVEHDGAPWWMVVNVGDSRVYALDEGVLGQVTVDHSFVQELVDRGDITLAQAQVHPERNIVTRAVGDRRRGCDAWLLPAVPGRRLIIASDGLMKAVDDARIASIAALAGGPEDAATRLVEAALEEGASDNVTVVVADTLHAHTPDGAAAEPWPIWGDEDDDTTVTHRRREHA